MKSIRREEKGKFFYKNNYKATLFKDKKRYMNKNNLAPN